MDTASPGPAVLSAAPAANAAPTRAALALPTVLVASKQRYPGAPPTDLDGPAQQRFQQNLGSRLRARLTERGLTLHDLLGKEHPALRREDAQRAAHKAALQALRDACPQTPPASLQGAMSGLRHLVRASNNAQLRVAQAEKAVAASSEATPDHAAAAARLAQAQTHAAAAEAALSAELPDWAQTGAPAAALRTAVKSALHLQVAEAATHRAARVTWLALGPRELTKLTHFAQGSFGKVTVGMRVEGQGLRALKDLRTQAGTKANSTAVSSLPEAQREVAYMQRFYDADVTLSRDPHTQKLTIDMPLALGSLNKLPAGVTDVDLIRSTGRQVFARLAEMHAQGALHNDLKPGNINVHADGRILPADFGKAGPLEVGADVGTAAYAAPEQLESQGQRETEADVWAAGLSLAAAHVSIESLAFDVEDVLQMVGAHRDYAQWHADTVDRGAPNPLHRLLSGSPPSPWTTYFQQLHAVDAPLCKYLLTHVLTPSAQQRATAAEASAFFAQLQPPDSPAEHGVQARLASQEDTRARQAAQVALQLRAELQAEETGR